MASMVDRICKCGCGEKFQARTADVKRGWGKFFSKSCKAKYQEKQTGQMGRHLARIRSDREDEEQGFSNAHLFSNED